jgi:hypothetical protein
VYGAGEFSAIGTGLSYTSGPESGQGEYSWSVPGDLPTGSYILKICDHDYPDIFFTQQIYIVDSEKNNGSLWTLQWSEIISDTVDIHYRTDGGEWVLRQSAVENNTGSEFGQGSYDWYIDTGVCDSLEVRISDTINEMYAYSPAVAVVDATTNNITVTAQIRQPASTGSIAVIVAIAGSAQIRQPQSSSLIAVTIAVNGVSQIGQPVSSGLIMLDEAPAENRISVNASIMQPSSIGSIAITVNVQGTSQIGQPYSTGQVERVVLITPEARRLVAIAGFYTTKKFYHDSDERLDYTIDLSQLWIDNDSISNVTFVMNSNITISVIQITNRSVQFWLSGSALQQKVRYEITCRVTSVGGRIEDVVLPVTIR